MKVEEFGNGAIREDKEGKGRFDLIPWCAIMRIAKHMQESLKVYEPRNWEKGLPMHSMIDSAFRHLAKYVDGQTDEDHLCAAATNLLMAMWTEEKHPEMQDIPTRSGAREIQSKPKQKKSKLCDCYDKEGHRCNGTKEQDPCNCGGDMRLCDFYEHIRKEAEDEQP